LQNPKEARKMKIIDISQPLFKARVFFGDTAPSIRRVKTVQHDKYNLSDISLCVHNGTHIDAPFHFIENAVGVDEIPLETFYGKCNVKEWDGNIPKGCERLLIKGDYVITENDARSLAESGIRLIGVESQSVGDAENPLPVHLILLGFGVVLLEGLVLGNVEDGSYTLSAFPLSLGRCDGSPVRAVLIEE
jgi:arylformamidase